MSQKVTTRKGALTEDKEKRQSPAKDVKKKMSSVTEKEKHMEKPEKSEKHNDKSEKPEKQNDKSEKQTDKKQVEKSENQTEKPEKHTDKKHAEKSEKHAEKGTEKNVDKKEKPVEKKETQGEKSKEDVAKEEKNAKNDAQDEKDKPQQNGTAKIHNGVADVTNGTANETNGTVSGESDDDDVNLVIDDEPDQDEMFPELTYDDNSDNEGFEPPIADYAPSRSLTRRSQVKATRTPETPRPASDRQTDKDSDADPKDSKMLKLKEDVPPASDRKLRSADSPRPQEGKRSAEPNKRLEKTLETVNESTEKTQDKEAVEKEGYISKQANEQLEVEQEDKVTKQNEKETEGSIQVESVEMEVIVEVEADDEKEEPRKVDTNYSKSRVKVSPYRRSGRLADQTSTSIMANYTGNNTTMEMDITESSLASDRESPPPEDASYLRGLRSIRARNSYKKLSHISLSNLSSLAAGRSARSLLNASAGGESRPTAPVVGRKRRPDGDRSPYQQHADLQPTGKRMRLLERIAHPFRRTLPHSTPAASPDIVGINTDLPLTAPVISADTFDPESLKLLPSAPTAPSPSEPLATPLATPSHHDSKRCVIM